MSEVYLPREETTEEVIVKIDTTEVSEGRLEEIRQEICAQETEADKLMLFLNQRRRDLMPGGFLRNVMLNAGMLPFGSRLLELFNFDEAMYAGTVEDLTKAIEKIPAVEVENLWQQFISEAEAALAEVPKTEQAEVAGWLLGPYLNSYAAKNDFLSPKATGALWPFRKGVPPAGYLAAVLTVEHGLNQVFSEMDRFLAFEGSEVTIDDAVDKQKLEQIFGSRGPAALFDLLSDSLRKTMRQIYVVDFLEDEEIVSDEEAETVLDVEVEPAYNLKTTGAVFRDGQFDYETRIMFLAINENSDPGRIIETWFHELGHAVIAGISLAEQAIRRRFLKAAATATPADKIFVGKSYDDFGLTRGLEEDFAEALRQYCLFPRIFQKNDPERFLAIKEIFAKYFPDFNLIRVQKKVETFLKEAEDRSSK